MEGGKFGLECNVRVPVRMHTIGRMNDCVVFIAVNRYGRDVETAYTPNELITTCVIV